MLREPPLPYGPPDEFGIPERMFSQVPEGFFGLMGRVAMVAAVLDDRPVTLLTQLTGSHQGKYAGWMPGRSLPELKKVLTTRRPELAAEGIGLVERLHSAFDGRNELIHSLWPHPTLEYAYGHRGVASGKRTDPNDFSVGITTNRAKMIAVMTELSELYAEVRRLEMLAQRPDPPSETNQT
ncbi:MAG: hypothetical protein ACR2P2_06470 [Nakamurella sp.]